MVLLAKLLRNVYIPGFRFLPTSKSTQRWKLEIEIKKCMRQIIEVRERTTDMEKSGICGTDLFGLMISS